MRTKQNTQPEFVFQLPSSAKVTREYFAAYDAISQILVEHPEIVTRVHRDLRKPLTKAKRRGPQGEACRYSSDTVLRMCLVKALENVSYRRAVVRVDDSPRLRAFTRIHNGPMLDFSTFCVLANAISPETWKVLNTRLAEAAASEGLITGEKLRIDTTATETNIHWPTDSGLLWDTYRVLERNVQRIREIHPVLLSDKRLQRKLAKRLHHRITMTSRHKTAKSKAERKRLYERLIMLVERILDWLPTLCERVRGEGARTSHSAFELAAAEALVQEIEHFLPLGRQAVGQARRRVLEGESVPNDEKLFSIFEPHTELLKRGRAGKEVEFGHMIAIQQVEGKFITDYAVFEKKPVEHELVDGALESHQRLFGKAPDVFAADKGFWESPFTTERLGWQVPLVAIGKKGKRTAEEKAHERSLPFRLAQNFRAGVEGSISFLKVMLGLWRCMNKGFKHFASTVGATVLAHNLLNLARGAG
ncbi:MAG: ISNCY family transposase [bacterium]|nr:ISNCY family transposase [bacterium]MCP5042972.1 ISNCY family transposase [bacterium]